MSSRNKFAELNIASRSYTIYVVDDKLYTIEMVNYSTYNYHKLDPKNFHIYFGYDHANQVIDNYIQDIDTTHSAKLELQKLIPGFQGVHLIILEYILLMKSVTAVNNPVGCTVNMIWYYDEIILQNSHRYQMSRKNKGFQNG